MESSRKRKRNVQPSGNEVRTESESSFDVTSSTSGAETAAGDIRLLKRVRSLMSPNQSSCDKELGFEDAAEQRVHNLSPGDNEINQSGEEEDAGHSSFDTEPDLENNADQSVDALQTDREERRSVVDAAVQQHLNSITSHNQSTCDNETSQSGEEEEDTLNSLDTEPDLENADQSVDALQTDREERGRVVDALVRHHLERDRTVDAAVQQHLNTVISHYQSTCDNETSQSGEEEEEDTLNSLDTEPDLENADQSVDALQTDREERGRVVDALVRHHLERDRTVDAAVQQHLNTVQMSPNQSTCDDETHQFEEGGRTEVSLHESELSEEESNSDNQSFQPFQIPPLSVSLLETTSILGSNPGSSRDNSDGLNLQERVQSHFEMLSALNCNVTHGCVSTAAHSEAKTDHSFLNQSNSFEAQKSFNYSTPVKIFPADHDFCSPVSPVPHVSQRSEDSFSAEHSEDGTESLDSETESITSPETRSSLSLRSESSSSMSQQSDNVSFVIEEDQDCDEDNVFTEARGLNYTKLYEGSTLSVNEAILKVMDLYLENKESKAGLRRVVQTFSSMLPDGHKLPSSDKIFKYLERLAPPVSEEDHYFCKDCVNYIDKADQNCTICKKPTEQDKFYLFDLSTVVKYLFEYRNLAAVLEQSAPLNEDRDTINDITDGSEYKTLNANRGKYDLTLILNGDGVRIRKGCESELWVLLCTFVEVPIHLRETFITVLGVWYSKVKPTNMNTFLHPFCVKVRSISVTGVQWKHPQTGVLHISYIRVLVVVADAPARAKFQNTMQFNAKYGCFLCEIRLGKCARHPAYKRRIRVYQYEQNPTLRTNARMLLQARLAVERGEPVKGVNGPSALSIIPSIDIAKCFVPDYLHSVLLGVVHQMICIWTTKKGDWNISVHIQEIDQTLRNICHPDFVHRTSRRLQKVSYWKASDFYYFLLFEALPVLKQFLPDRYFQHFILIVISIFSLLKRSIQRIDLDEADFMLNLFVNEFVRLYPDRQLTHNVHLLLHLVLSVKRHGPLSTVNAFPFEGMNGIIAKATHGTYNVGQEIVNNVKICQGIAVLRKVTQGLDGFHSVQFSQGCALGKEKKDIILPEEELALFAGRKFNLYSRAKLGYETFTSLIHKKLKSVNYYVMFSSHEDTTEFASIKYFAVSDGKLIACLKMFSRDHLNVLYHTQTLKTVKHLTPVLETNKVIFIEGDVLSSFVKVGKVKNYLFNRPNRFHQVL